MPICEYICNDCNNHFEALQKLGESILTNCPKCGGTVKKLISAPNINISRKSSIQQQLPMTGRNDGSVFTRPLDWPKGRLLGVKEDQIDRLKWKPKDGD